MFKCLARKDMDILMILLICKTVRSGISQISPSSFSVGNFAKATEGWKLNGRVISETTVDSENSCRLKCVEDGRCQSYNFGTVKDSSGKFVCQLSDSDRFVGRVYFTEDKDFRYRGIKRVCIPGYQGKSVRCNCSEGYTGKPCKPKSCAQLLQDGFTSSRLYTINPDGGKPMQVLCDMVTDGGGWTVFQKRLDGSVDFFLGWESYKNGFGNMCGEFWLGNDNLHRLTAADDVTLRVDVEDFEGNIRYAEYTTFKVADEADKYRLLIGGYSGTAGDSFSYHNNQLFSTKDSDNAGSCAQTYKGAWWYKNCHGSNLNGFYYGGPHASYGDGVCWKAFRGFQYSLKRAEMKVKLIHVG